MPLFSAIARYLHARRVRKTREAIAYLTGVLEVLARVHIEDSFYGDRLIEATANKRKYEARLACLMENNIK